ncbi:MAG: outer membrane protein assembly factor BamD [Candidatus Latescibacteria bacterium]|nr:outer membrane protein assembly factor BamD [Candidatus Latescibacterota bacterium]
MQFFNRSFFSGILLVIIAVGLAAGCSRKLMREEELLDEQFYFDRGMKMMKKKDYIKAITDFQTVVDSYSDKPIVDHAQFMLGEAHFMAEEYLTAAFEFERVYTDYPSSPFAPEAQYKKALCYYMESPDARLDQANTQLAIDEFNRFIDTYPTNDLVEEAQKKIAELQAKMAYKEYLNGETYRKLKDYDAAIFYYRWVIKEYPRTIWSDYSRYRIAETHFKKKEYELAHERLLVVINADVDKDLRKKAVDLMDKIESELSK